MAASDARMPRLRIPWSPVGGPRGVLIALAVLAFIAGTGWWQLAPLLAGHAPARPAPVIATGPLHALVDHDGRPFEVGDLDGRAVVVFFGFTHCPDVCPLELATVALALDRLGAAADQVRAVFVSVDPERDTPERLGAYVGAFHPRLVGLTGTPEAIAAAAGAFGARFARVELDDGDYTVDHLARIFVLDGERRLVAALPFASPPEALLAALQPLLGAARLASGTR